GRLRGRAVRRGGPPRSRGGRAGPPPGRGRLPGRGRPGAAPRSGPREPPGPGRLREGRLRGPRQPPADQTARAEPLETEAGHQIPAPGPVKGQAKEPEPTAFPAQGRRGGDISLFNLSCRTVPAPSEIPITVGPPTRYNLPLRSMRR